LALGMGLDNLGNYLDCQGHVIHAIDVYHRSFDEPVRAFVFCFASRGRV
jgi:hypothetical protein